MQPVALPPGARRENALLLASLVSGLDAASAETRFDCSFIVRSGRGSAAVALADDVYRLLERTFTHVERQRVASDSAPLTVECCSVHDRPILTVDVGRNVATLCWESLISANSEQIHDLTRLMLACYVAAAVTARALPELGYHLPEKWHICFGALGFSATELTSPVEIVDTIIAGVGAVGGAFLEGLARLDVRGKLGLADPDYVSEGNLQRQICFTNDDVGQPKVEAAIKRLQPRFSSLALYPAGGLIEEVAKRGTLKRVVDGLDSPRARRRLQEAMPLEIFDASTTRISEIITFESRLASGNACLACVYPYSETEKKWAEHVAEVLGVLPSDVEQDVVSSAAAESIAARHRICADDLVGQRYDTLFKQICGALPAPATAENRAAAPFAFVSVLAGVFLAYRLYRSLASRPLPGNYWNVSPWHPPRLENLRAWRRDPACKVCGRPAYERARTKIVDPTGGAIGSMDRRSP